MAVQPKITTRPIPSASGSKRAHETIHYITVKGVYSASGGEQGRLLSKPYEITFRCRDSQHKKDGALSLFKHRVGPRVLAAHDRRFVGILEHHILETRTEGYDLPTDVKLMNRSQLCEYIDQRSLEVRADLYADLGQLQTAVIECEDDPIAFVKQQDHIAGLITKRVGGTFWEDFDDLNSDLFVMSDATNEDAGVIVRLDEKGNYEVQTPETLAEEKEAEENAKTNGKPKAATKANPGKSKSKALHGVV